jgi:hypothetical protein
MLPVRERTYSVKLNTGVVSCCCHLIILKFYVMPTDSIHMSFMNLRTNSDYFPIQH